MSVLAMVRAPMLLSAAGLVLLLANTSSWRPGDLSKHWIPKVLLALLIIAILGVPTSIYPGRSFRFITDSFSRSLLIAIMIWAVCRTVRGTEFMIKVLVSAGTTAALLALMYGARSQGRLSGAYTYDANDLALIANVCIPLAVWWFFSVKTLDRYLGLAALPFLLQVVVKSGSRGGFLGMAAIVVALTFMRGRRLPRKLRRVSMFTAVAGFVALPFLPGDYLNRVRSIGAENDYNITSPRGRKQVWKRGIGYAVDHPLLGVGIDNFRTAEGRISELAVNRLPGQGLKWSAAHNSFLQILAEMGFVAGVLFVMLIFRSIRDLIRLARARPPPGPEQDGPMVAPLVATSIIAYAVSGFFLSFAYYDIVYVLFAITTALLMRGSPAGRGRRPRRQRPLGVSAPVNLPGAV